MKTLIQFQNKKIPVYTVNATSKKALNVLMATLDKKIKTGKTAVKRCLSSLISIEIVGCEAILHCMNEEDTLALSLY
jgi:hypothetical protein